MKRRNSNHTASLASLGQLCEGKSQLLNLGPKFEKRPSLAPLPTAGHAEEA